MKLPVRTAPLRAVFLDVGDTVMRPSPSWEHIYAMAFAEYGITVDVDALRDALREAYHHGGWGMEGGFEPNEEASFQRTVEIDHVQTRETSRFKPFCGFERVIGINRLTCKIALREPHAFAPDKIHCGNDFDHILKKFSKMRAPASPDFSG